jgi:hypothetical protein
VKIVVAHFVIVVIERERERERERVVVVESQRALYKFVEEQWRTACIYVFYHLMIE